MPLRSTHMKHMKHVKTISQTFGWISYQYLSNVRGTTTTSSGVPIDFCIFLLVRWILVLEVTAAKRLSRHPTKFLGIRGEGTTDHHAAPFGKENWRALWQTKRQND